MAQQVLVAGVGMIRTSRMNPEEPAYHTPLRPRCLAW